jgi:hypothetical protein
VPPGWQHPRDEHGRHIPLFDRNADPHEQSDEELPGVAGRLAAMPRWAPEEATCYQVYEDVTEGTPVSPVFDSLDGVRGWLVDQGYSRRAVEGFCRRGQAPTLVVADGEVYPDIESGALLPDEEQPP